VLHDIRLVDHAGDFALGGAVATPGIDPLGMRPSGAEKQK
jgi:hypothetical protein